MSEDQQLDCQMAGDGQLAWRVGGWLPVPPSGGVRGGDIGEGSASGDSELYLAYLEACVEIAGKWGKRFGDGVAVARVARLDSPGGDSGGESARDARVGGDGEGNVSSARRSACARVGLLRQVSWRRSDGSGSGGPRGSGDVCGSAARQDVAGDSARVSSLVEPVVGRGSVGLNCERGPNWERNNRWREKKRRAKGRRELSAPSVGTVPSGPLISQEESLVETQGFWRSCSDDVRQQLIDSKARMHIAENERRARKARLDVERMNAPVAILEEAMRHVRLAQRCAKEKGDSKVAGWAETVANSYAESVARSAPSTIPSYASVASTATSVSVDGSARVKPGSVKWFERRISALRTLKEMYVVYGELERATNLTAPQKQMVDLMLDDCRDRLASNK